MKAPFLFLIWLIISTPVEAKGQSIATVATVSPESDQNEPYRSRHFMVDGVADLKVFTPSGDIEVVYNPDLKGVKVDLYVKRGFSLWSGSQNLDNYRIIFRQNGNAITTSVERKHPAPGRFGSDDVKFTFVIQAPKEILTNLRSMSGDILLNGVVGRQFLQSDAGNLSLKNSEGELSLYSSAGSVSLENNNGYVQVKTVAGDVHIEKNRGEARIRSVSGNIYSREMMGSFICATVSGNIDASFDSVFEGVHLETITGNVHLELNEVQGFDVKTETMKLNLDQLPASYISERTSGRRTTMLKLGEGGIPVNIKTVSGSVEIKPKGN
ncbi:MAG: DUF4097 family beta strand repeat-containing protein [Balneolaceae bacterium]